MCNDYSSIRSWRQGDIVEGTRLPEAIEALGEVPDSILVVVSADCDVSNLDFDKEPYVEILMAVPIDRPDGNLTNGKNPRRLHFRVSVGGSDKYFEADIDQRARIDRRLLLDVEAERPRSLPQRDLRALRGWISKRYFRSAFPDTFNDRLAPQAEPIRTRAKQGAENITSIWFTLNTHQELDDSTSYMVQIVGLMTEEEYARADRREEAQRCFDDIVARIDAAAGIEVEEAYLTSEADFSLADVRVSLRWDMDNLTVRLADSSEPPAEGSW